MRDMITDDPELVRPAVQDKGRQGSARSRSSWTGCSSRRSGHRRPNHSRTAGRVRLRDASYNRFRRWVASGTPCAARFPADRRPDLGEQRVLIDLDHRGRTARRRASKKWDATAQGLGRSRAGSPARSSATAADEDTAMAVDVAPGQANDAPLLESMVEQPQRGGRRSTSWWGTPTFRQVPILRHPYPGTSTERARSHASLHFVNPFVRYTSDCSSHFCRRGTPRAFPYRRRVWATPTRTRRRSVQEAA